MQGADFKPALMEKRFFTLTFMASATPNDEKSASIVGAGFKPALRREIGSIRHGTALGGFETRPKPRFVLTSGMFSR